MTSGDRTAQPPSFDEVPGDDDLRRAGSAVVEAARARILQVFDLAVAEARLAAMSTITMVLLVIVASAALIVAWILLVGFAIYALMQAEVPWPAAALGLSAAHIGIAYGLWRTTVKLSRNLTLPELRGALAAIGARTGETAYAQVEGTTRARAA